MNGLNICYLTALVPALIAAVYGIAVILRKYRGLYFVMEVMAIVCLMIGQLAYCITAFTGASRPSEFHIGTLGAVGSCLFFMTANIGPMNQLADDNREQLQKYRLLASTGPIAAVILLAFCVFIMNRRNCYIGFTTSLIMTAFTVVPLYFSTKMAIIPDVEDGFISCMRPNNYAVTVLGLLNTLERGMRNLWFGDTVIENLLMYALYISIGLCTLVVIMLLKKGAKRWTEILL